MKENNCTNVKAFERLASFCASFRSVSLGGIIFLLSFPQTQTVVICLDFGINSSESKRQDLDGKKRKNKYQFRHSFDGADPQTEYTTTSQQETREEKNHENRLVLAKKAVTSRMHKFENFDFRHNGQSCSAFLVRFFQSLSASPIVSGIHLRLLLLRPRFLRPTRGDAINSDD